ncbi:3',5'-cyclic-AMP phosphodiesterase [Shewanella algidipiscicola]|uniref:3',5'-cyclic adenosine monophosphate phosphodiesterase CpdA n=1 Tax=Shewanella algidipiscicola TaxID=614070 RepID=A0ABQ4PCM1_9GAMM|nr:3',5'-cyclic-AMP phosphodiesterase [Shewanella algidipiscicola]GIU45312.1 3',5'-cyclic adenosine monophosphate phosphodiesterase CpdA [Shewanella algidipiscicola]
MLKEAISYSIGDGESVRLVQVTDPHLFADREAQLLGVNTANSLDAVLNTIKAVDYPAHLMLATGDISQDYSHESYHNFVRAIVPLNLPCHYLPGNHDDPRVMHLHMQGPRVYGEQRILAGNWQIIMLDSTVRGKPGGHMAETQLALIESAVAAQPDKHTLLVMHHNPILVGCQWLDQHCMDNGSDFIARVAKLPQVKGLLWGHVHQSLDQTHPTEHGTMRLMATPSTCIQFKPKSPYFALDAQQPGYRLLELKSDGGILTNVYRVPGNKFSPDHESSGY